MIYKEEHLKEISFPLGGIGTGSIGLSGDGRLVDWEIFNRPQKGSLNGYSHIAVKLCKDGKSITKILNSDLLKEFTGRYEKTEFEGFGHGPSAKTMCGFPHFKHCEFSGEFPIAELTFTDEDFPGKVVLRAFNPFIPLDSDNSSIPAAFFEIIYKNEENTDADFQCAFSLSNPYREAENTVVKKDKITSVKLIRKDKTPNERDYGELAISCENPTSVQPYWYRGNWQDGVSTYWNEFCNNDTLLMRTYDAPWQGNDVCTVVKSEKLKPGEEKSIRFVLSWNVPNNYVYWDNREKFDTPDCTVSKMTWKNYYTKLFEDSVASGVYSIKNWDFLYKKTKEFKDELFSSTVDDVIKEAVSSTISVLKSQTVYRLENGELYGFEGNHENAGSCAGTCQHVYNYAYALCFLFPDLERSVRNLEFTHGMNEDGRTAMRLALPICKATKGASERFCLDGQMGAVIKTYREWKISGDNKWLESVWQNVKKALEYAWSEKNIHKWDYDKDGVLEGRQHHTLDMELFGPSSWLQGFYLAALKAAHEMALFLGEDDKAEEYLMLFEKGRKWSNENLFNGRYFIQKIDLKDKAILEKFDCTNKYWNEETGEIKYQVGNGSSIDQLTGQWHAHICGLGDIFDKEKMHTAVKNMYDLNFKKSMRNVANMWRVFALDDEAGAIMCDYPEGVYKPRIPITYCEECMTGFEYQFAGILLREGFYDEAIEVVKAIRNRYDGKKRNPWNEIECGSNYVRAMASYALLPILSGFTFDLPKYTIGFNPIKKEEPFKCIWSLGSGWGNVNIQKEKTTICIKKGELTLEKLCLSYLFSVKKVIIDGNDVSFEFKNGTILFEKTSIKDYIEII